MRVSFALISVATATKLSSYDQGAKFNKCIKLDDWHTKTIDDDIDLTDYDADGCCAEGTVPGAFYENAYQGSQVTCVKANKNMGSAGDCDYGQCYIFKQDLACDDDEDQRINGCCADGDEKRGPATFTGFDDDCLGYLKSFKNSYKEDAKFCTTYHKTYGSIGRMGTTDQDDDTSDDGLNIACIDEYSACCGHLERNAPSGGCTGDMRADYMAKSNAALTENQCKSVSRSSSGGDSDSDTEGNSSDNAVTAGVGCSAALVAAAVAM
jgi:hypothetical protein